MLKAAVRRFDHTTGDAAQAPKGMDRGRRLVGSLLGALSAVSSLSLLGFVAISAMSAPAASAACTTWTAYVYNLSGQVTPVNCVQSGSPTLGANFNSPAPGRHGGDSASGTSLTPDGKYLFASNYAQNSVSVFSTATNKQVTTLTTNVSGPYDNAVSPDGTQLWVADFSTNALTVFCVAAAGCNNGTYTQWQEMAYITGSGLNGPIDVAISPNDEYAYAANYNGYTVSIFCANFAGCYGTPVFGAMGFSPLALYPANSGCATGGGCGIDWTAFTPDGQYAYVADCGNTSCGVQGDISMIQNAEGSNPTFVSRNTTGGYGTNQVDISPNCTAGGPTTCTMYVTNFNFGGYGNIQVYAGADNGGVFPTLQKTYGHAQNPNVYNPNYFAVSPDSNYLIVSDAGAYGSGNSDQIDVFSTATDTVTTTLTGQSNYPWTVAVQPDQAPTASLLAYPSGYGQPSFFDASGSTNPLANPSGGAAITKYTWNFGDGCTATTTGTTGTQGSQVTFAYPSTNGAACPSPTLVNGGSVASYSGTVALSGTNTYTVSVTVTNWAGTSTTEVYTGHTVSNNGAPSAQATKTITLPTKLAITSSPTSGVTMASATSAPNIGPITIQMQTASGSPVNAPPSSSGVTDTISLGTSPAGYFAAYDTATGACDLTTDITSVNVPAGQSSVQVCFGDTTAETDTVTFTGSGGATGLTAASESITVAANSAYQLAFTTPAFSHICIYNATSCAAGPSGTAGEAGPVTVQVQNASGSPVNPASTVNVTLSSTTPGSGTATFYSASGGACSTTTTTSVSIPTTSNSASFCYSYTVPDTQPAITATATSGFPATHGTIAPSQTESIAGPATQLVFTTPSESALYITGTTPDMGPIVVALADSSGYLTNATANLNVTMSSTTPGGGTAYFCPWSGTSCSGADTNTYTISPGGQSITIGYGYTKGNKTVTLTAAATGLTSGTQNETVASGPPAQIAITSAALSGAASSTPNLGPITVTLEDSGGFSSPATVAQTISLSSNSATGAFSVWNGTSCGTTTVTSVTIGVGSSQASFCYGDTTAGTPQVSAVDASFLPDTSCGNVGMACQSETVTAASPATLVIITGAKTGVASSTANLGPITVQLQDAYGNVAVAPAGGEAITLSSTGAGAVFSGWSGTACTGSAPTSIAAGASTASFCYGDTKAGSDTVKVSSTGLNPATQVETVNPGSPYQLVITTAALSGPPAPGSPMDPNLGPITFAIEDNFGNPVSVSSSYTINLTYTASVGGSTGAFSAWTGTSCSTTQTTTATIGSGTSQTSVCFGGNLPTGNTSDTYTITGTTSGLTTNAASQNETVKGGVWNQNAFSDSEQQALTGDFYAAAQLNSSPWLIAVGDNAQTCCAYGQVAYAYGSTGSANVTSVFDGNQVDQPHGQPVQVDAGHSIVAMSCPTSSFCAAVDSAGNGLTWNGGNLATSWTLKNIDGSNSFNAISCYSPTFCLAVDNFGNAFTYQGTWAATTSPGDILTAVSCFSATECYVADRTGNYASFTSGVWGTFNATGDTNLVKSLSCLSTSFCVGVDNAGNALYCTSATACSGSGTWTVTAVDATNRNLDSVSCATTTGCWAVDASGYAFDYTGSWSAGAHVDTVAGIDAVSCVDDTVSSVVLCGAVDAKGNVLFNNGSTWTSTNVDGTTSLGSIACMTPSFCMAGDASGYELGLLDNGSAASVSTSINATNPGTSYLEGISCPTTSPASNLCVIVGFSQASPFEGVIITTTDPTNPWSWTLAGTFSQASDLSGVTCINGSSAASTTCFAVGYGSDTGSVDKGGVLLQSTNGGSSWTDVSSSIASGNVPGGTVVQLTGVACVSSTECYAVGTGYNPAISADAGVTVYYGGSGWQIGRYAATSGEFTGISCPAASTCFASGDSGGFAQIYYDTNASSATSSWSASFSSATGITYLFDMSCISTTQCYAAGFVDAADAGVNFNGKGTTTVAGGIVISSGNPTSGSSWQIAENDKFGETAWFGMACSTVSCTAVGSTYNGQTSYGFSPVAATGS